MVMRRPPSFYPVSAGQIGMTEATAEACFERATDKKMAQAGLPAMILFAGGLLAIIVVMAVYYRKVTDGLGIVAIIGLVVFLGMAIFYWRMRANTPLCQEQQMLIAEKEAQLKQVADFQTRLEKLR